MDPYHQPNLSVKALVQCTKTWVRGSYLLYQLQFHRELDGRFLSWAQKQPVPKVTKTFGEWGNTCAVCWGETQPRSGLLAGRHLEALAPALLSSATSWLWAPWIHGSSVFGFSKHRQSNLPACQVDQSKVIARRTCTPFTSGSWKGLRKCKRTRH